MNAIYKDNCKDFNIDYINKKTKELNCTDINYFFICFLKECIDNNYDLCIEKKYIIINKDNYNINNATFEYINKIKLFYFIANNKIAIYWDENVLSYIKERINSLYFTEADLCTN